MTSPNNLYKSNHPPPLPTNGVNPLLHNYKGKLRGVRTQVITLGPNATITIARIKIPSPDKSSLHLIKRFDTNAISANSFFKSAFPLAPDQDLTTHMKYIEQIYDTRSAGALSLGLDRKLTGVWVPIEYANELAEAYGLTSFAAPLIACPDPDPKPDVVTSPTVLKKDLEQKNESSNQPTPKLRSNHNSKQVVNQTPTGVRSTKRSKVGPPSFGNTSPSNFNLTSVNKSTHDSKKANVHPPVEDESIDGHPTIKPTISSPISPVDNRITRQKIPETNVDLPIDKNVKETNSQPEEVNQESGSLIGTDEQVIQAREEARQLVSSFKSSSSTCTTQEKNTPYSKSDDTNQPTSDAKTNEDSTPINRKRGLDEILEEDQSDQTTNTESSTSLIRSSFLKRPFWRRANQHSEKLTKRVIHSNPKKNETQSTGEQSLNEIDSTKRNMAIVGIFIAGAAASIVPYFF